LNYISSFPLFQNFGLQDAAQDCWDLKAIPTIHITISTSVEHLERIEGNLKRLRKKLREKSINVKCVKSKQKKQRPSCTQPRFEVDRSEVFQVLAVEAVCMGVKTRHTSHGTGDDRKLVISA